MDTLYELLQYSGQIKKASQIQWFTKQVKDLCRKTTSSVPNKEKSNFNSSVQNKQKPYTPAYPDDHDGSGQHHQAQQFQREGHPRPPGDQRGQHGGGQRGQQPRASESGPEAPRPL